ncbi:hypothetical protein DM02DRAFT_617329 [Periconia macrospinosa]|uniref:Uncharacterized protein n=1 Tax=Periconia macrospinosa TaxID=97972 RepID=A0A2V1DE36_9PLEO|nr:hypothetical protein DM02DRAFT_617329 [Periconia macrospinosa]
MGPWGVQFGMMKKLANIRFTPVGGDEFEVVAHRLGKLVFRVVIGMGEEIRGAERDNLLTGRDNPMTYPTFTVRELPNADWSGYLDQSVLRFDSPTMKIEGAWRADRASIELGNAESDPLDELRVQDPQAIMIGHLRTPRKGLYNHERDSKLT